MKKLITLFVLLFVVVYTATTAFADEHESGSKKVITIGYVSGYGAISDLNSIEEKGYLYDLFNRVKDYGDYVFEFKEYPNGTALEKALETNEVQYIGPLMRTEDEEEKYLFAFELSNAVISLVSKDAVNKLHYNDPTWIDGKTVASYHNSTLEKYLNEYCQKHNISVNYVHGNTEGYAETSADLYLVSSAFGEFSQYQSVLNLATYPLYIATSHQNAELNAIISEIFAEAIASDVDFIYELHEKYYGDSKAQRRYLTKNEVELLQNRTFKVAFDSNYNFYSYLNENGDPDGIFVNIFNLLAKKNGIGNIKYLPYQIDGEGENSFEYVLEHADFVISSLGEYEYFKDRFTLSDTYMNIPLTMIVNDEIYHNTSNPNEQKMGLLRNMFLPENSIDEIFHGKQYQIYHSGSKLIDDFEDGIVDGFLMSESSVTSATALIKRDFHRIVTDIEAPAKIWVSNRLGNDYVKIVNVIFDHLELDEISDIILAEQQKYKKIPTIAQTILANKVFFSLLFSSVLFLIIITCREKINRKKERILLEVDSLTGLMSKYKFEKDVANILKTAKSGEYLLMSIDIDNFKILNKIYGYDVGDSLLRLLGNNLRDCMSGKKPICRVHNDDFMLLLHNKENKLSINNVNENLIENYKKTLEKSVTNNLEQKLKSIGINSSVYFSIGLYLIEDTTIKLSYMMDCAQAAKKKNKNIFGNTITFFTKDFQRKQEKADTILSTMESAISNNEFFIVIQPKVELNTHTIIGGEVLVRWKKPNGTFIYPDEFIPLFEKNDFIIKLDHFVLEKTCQLICSKICKLPPLSVNVSTTTVLQKNFIQSYVDILNNYGILPSQIELELTESVFDRDFEYISATINELKKLGFTVAIDDFGKGASSLARIKEINADILKLDKDFLGNQTENEKGKIVIENIISMANSLNFITLAEGVETKENLALLQELGCKLGQGYLFDKPIPADEFCAC